MRGAMPASSRRTAITSMVEDEQSKLLWPNWLGQSDEEVLGKLLGSTRGAGSAPELDSD